MQDSKQNKKFLRRYKGQKYEWFQVGKIFLILVVIIVLAFTFLIGLSKVSGHSMDYTLANGEVVFYSRIGDTYEQGDIIAIRIPTEEYYVKRVIAVGGDVVDIRDGGVYVNDVLLDESEYVVGETYPQESAVEYPYTVAEGDVFVLGDNREVSMDSRSIGAVSIKQIKGKLIIRVGRFYIDKL